MTSLNVSSHFLLSQTPFSLFKVKVVYTHKQLFERVRAERKEKQFSELAEKKKKVLRNFRNQEDCINSNDINLSTRTTAKATKPVAG